jgi:hypothetical protein
MDAALGRLRALDPAKPEPLFYALAQNQLAGRDEAARAALDELLFRHGATASVYTPAAAVLVELRQAEALGRLEQELRDRGLPIRPVLQARLQLAVARRDWPSVLASAEALRANLGTTPADTSNAWLETVTRLARACIDNASGTQASLVEIVADHPGTLRLYKLLLETLLDSGRPATARQILTLAEGPYQNARSIVALRARIESTLAAMPPVASGPSTASSSEFASFSELTAALETRIQASDTPGALGLINSARRARPGWLFAHEPALDGLELSLRARGDDPLRLQFLARAALERDPDAPDHLLALARQIMADNPGLRPNALLLLKETLSRFPSHADALAQLATWEPRDGARAPLDVGP